MTSIDLTPRENICCFTYFLTPKLNFSACSKKTSQKAVFWTISPGLHSQYEFVWLPSLFRSGGKLHIHSNVKFKRSKREWKAYLEYQLRMKRMPRESIESIENEICKAVECLSFRITLYQRVKRSWESIANLTWK